MKNGVHTAVSFSTSEERINRLMDGLRVGVLLQSPDSEILFSNNAALEMLGLTEEELYGRSSNHPEWNVIHEDGTAFPGEDHPVPVSIRTKKTVSNVVMGVYRPLSKDRIWLQVNAEPLLDVDGNVKEVICSFNDITGRKSIEEKLTSLYQSLEFRALELATSNNDMQRFVHVATHDLQEPLRMVSSFTQLLKKKYKDKLDEQANEYIDYAVEGAGRLKKLILDLLEYSKFSGNREEFTETDMNDVLLELCNKYADDISNFKIEIISQRLPVIKAKPMLMTQLFDNLIGNAIKYRGSGQPLIEIKCTEKEDHFLFSVSDNGIGIDKKYSEKIFVLFQRLHNNNEAYEGTGVGLAICKKIVDLHKGTIWVESSPGEGSTFYFTIAKSR
ncbi:MAG TPA: ATP-binding protein [Chitinophagaceae bacterium]|nr:ATP-binding protein [Chitinophagaceae bacterium]